LFHDKTLDRTTDAKIVFPGRKSYRLSEFTLEELTLLNTGSVFTKSDPFGMIRKGHVGPEALDAMKTEKIPTLEQALLLTREKQWAVNLELKETIDRDPPFPVVEKVVETIRATKIPARSVKISSFSHQWLAETRGLMPEIEVQALIAPKIIEAALDPDSPFETFNIDQALIDKNIMTRLLQKGKTVNAYTVNSVKKADKFRKLGVNAVFSDYPQILAPFFQGKFQVNSDSETKK
jgi:glycerophosphoryl diester phosphodiesterase